MNLEYLTSNKNNKIKGPIVFYPEIFHDERGYFYETWNKEIFNQFIFDDVDFIQDNQSVSKKNVLRGLHFQLDPRAQCKLVRVVKGKVNDVIVDLRLNSPTFSEWSNIELSCKRNNQLWIPRGFAHGFLSLTDNTILQYKVNNYWSPKHERTLKWNDNDLNIKWHNKDFEKFDFIISNKDQNGFSLNYLIQSNEIFF